VRLHVQPELEIWLVCWLDGQTLPLRDPVACRGCIFIAEGSLTERIVEISQTWSVPRAYTRGANTAFCFDGDRIHSIGHANDGPALSIHAHTPSRAGSHRGIFGQGRSGRAPARAGDLVVI